MATGARGPPVGDPNGEGLTGFARNLLLTRMTIHEHHTSSKGKKIPNRVECTPSPSCLRYTRNKRLVRSLTEKNAKRSRE